LRCELAEPQIEIRGAAWVVEAFERLGESVRRILRHEEEHGEGAAPSPFLEMRAMSRYGGHR
jgi:hypothetical protein